jgi:hypothetical protein
MTGSKKYIDGNGVNCINNMKYKYIKESNQKHVLKFVFCKDGMSTRDIF